MTDSASDIAAGRDAWERLRNCRAGFDDWVAVGRALVVGRAECMALAMANAPQGSRYNKMMGQWLDSNGLAGISPQERYRAVLIIENLPEIQLWRQTLPPDTCRKLNHPGAIW
jgi:hypothetical protein